MEIVQETFDLVEMKGFEKKVTYNFSQQEKIFCHSTGYETRAIIIG